MDRDGQFKFDAYGMVDGEEARVKLYGEHRNAIKKAGYDIASWSTPRPEVGHNIVCVIGEYKGIRRVSEVLIFGTEDEWIEVKQRG